MNPFPFPLPVVRAYNSSWSAVSNVPPHPSTPRWLNYLLCHPWSLLPPLLLPDKAGFGNNFATGDNKSLAQNMEAVVVGCMFKSLITRCASTTHELHSPENLVSVERNHRPICLYSFIQSKLYTRNIRFRGMLSTLSSFSVKETFYIAPCSQ